MDDLISRRAAIDALDFEIVHMTAYCDGKNEGNPLAQYNKGLEDGKKAIEALPSAQPEPCGDKSYALWKESYEELKRRMDELTSCSDIISRQAAIDAVSGCGICTRKLVDLPPIQPEPQWIPVSERLPSKEEYKEWIDNNLDGIGYLYPCLVTRYSSINPDRTKNNPYVAKHYFDGEDFLNAGEEVCSEYIIAWMPLPTPYTK